MKRPRYPGKRRPRLLSAGLGALVVFFVFLLYQLFSGDEHQAGPLSEQAAGTLQAFAATALTPDEEYPQGPLAPGTAFSRLKLEKGKRLLTAFSQGKAVRLYLVALGENPVGPKEFQGDKKTPEGDYAIDGKNPNSAYYKNLGISYPNQADREHARRLGKSPGGDIKIHGLAPDYAEVGKLHRVSDWTHGCVALSNEEMEELYAHTAVGTPIEIVP